MGRCRGNCSICLGVKDITKAHAIDALLEYLGADIEDTYAFGDAK